jgi:phenylalanyl-tRNA synthetase beta chain
VDFFDIKGEVESFLWKIALDKWRFISYSTSDGLTDTALAIEIHGSYAGYLGRVSSEVLKTLDVEGEVFFAELALSPLAQYAGKKFEPLPRFPRVRRDVAFFVDGSVSVERLEASIRKAAGELLSAVEVFDVYQGDVVAQGKKSVAFALELMSREKTLTDAEIDAAIRRIAEAVASECGGTLRSQRTA